MNSNKASVYSSSDTTMKSSEGKYADGPTYQLSSGAPPLTEDEIDEMLNSDGIAGDVEFLEDIVSMAAKSTRERIDGIQVALKASNGEEIWRLAHAIKSTCLMSNMVSFGRAAINVERSFRNPSQDDIQNRPAFLKDLFYEASRLLNTQAKLSNRK